MPRLDIPMVVIGTIVVLCATLGARMAANQTQVAEAATEFSLNQISIQDQALRERETDSWARSFESAKQRAFEAGLSEGRALAATSEYPARLLEQRRLEFRDQGKSVAEVLATKLSAKREDMVNTEQSAIVDGAVAAGRREASSWSWAMVAGLVACVLVALWWRQSVMSPLARLAQTMDDVADGGESRVSLLTGGSQSVQKAQTAFNRTADALSATRRDLQVAVDRKTAALGTALKESQALNERLRAVLAELEATQALLASREKLAALGTFAGGVAHEFNNILGGIRGCTRDLLQDDLDQDQRETLEVIERAAERGRKIVDGLSQFSKGGERPSQRISLWPVVQEVLALLGPSGAEQGVTLRAERTPETLSDCVEANSTEIHQVLVNLVRNALQHAPGGTDVLIQLEGPSESRLDESEDSRITLTVSDQGPGVAPEDVKSLFLPFFTTREREGGTGLGLAISHGMVRAARGELKFQPNSPRGAQFVISLPLAEGGEMKEPS